MFAIRCFSSTDITGIDLYHLHGALWRESNEFQVGSTLTKDGCYSLKLLYSVVFDWLVIIRD